MTKQSYKKFVATAATATLVASALAPVAASAATENAFTDVGGDYIPATNYLAEKGITGFGNGIFKPSEDITRADAAVLIAKVLGLPTDAPSAGFTDVKRADAVVAVNALKAAGITNGKTATTFGATDQVTRGEVAIWLQRAFKLETGADAGFTDAHGQYKNAVNALKNAGVTNGKTATTFGVVDNITRGELAIFLYKLGKEEVVETKIESVKAINSKTIEVKFNQVVDTDKAKVELLRGTFKQNATAKWSDDKKSVTLEVPGQLQTAEYTVNVNGLAEKTLTGSVNVEEQKVASIEILDDLAVIDSKGSVATVTYVVKDQYGEDVTKKFPITAGTDHTIEENTVKINITDSVKEGSKVAIVLIHADTGVTATETVTISKASAVNEISVKGIYDEKGKEVALNEDSKGTYYVVLNLKDQYGKKVVDETTVNKMFVTNTNEEVLKTAKNITVKPIGDENEAVVEISKVEKAGSTKLILISSSNGKTAQYDIAVSETTRTDAVSLIKPEHAVLGKDILLPLSVTDKEGAAVTDINILKNTNKGITVTGGEVVVKDGQSYVKATLNPEAKAGDFHTVLVQTSTNKTATATFKLEKQAEATIITGVKNPLVVKDNKTVQANELIVKDQYDQDIEINQKDFEVKAVNPKSSVLEVENNVIKAKKSGKDKVKIQLVGKPNSAIEVEVQVTDGKEYKSYEAKDLGLVDINNLSDKPIVISGVLAEGGKVELKDNDYTAVTNVVGVTVEDNQFVIEKDAEENIFKVDGKDVTEREVKVTFTINNDGSKVEHTYKISNEESKVQDFFFTNATTDETAPSVAKEITEATLKSGSTVAELMSLGDTPKLVNVATTDQYGKKKVEAISATTVTIVPEKATEVNIKNNGKNNATVTLVNEDKPANVTFKVTINGVTKDIKVKVTPQ